MNSLIGYNINWFVFLGIAIVIVLFPDITIFSFFALLISLHQFLLLFYSVGFVIPVRYLFGSLMCLQILVGPSLAYFVEITKRDMVIPQDEYFNYAIPAVICFILGLHIGCKKLEGELINENQIIKYVTLKAKLPFILIGIGFFASFIASMFSSDLAFVFYLLANMKFIGVFMIIIGSQKLKIIPLVLVYSSIIISSLDSAMFHDLMTWLIFLGIIFAIKYRPPILIKSFLAIGFIVFAIIIQGLKKDYREATWQEGKNSGLETFSTVYKDNKAQGGVFNSTSLAKNIVRINQGFIVTNIMKRVPSVLPFSNGAELNQILTAAILPRILAPGKLTAGNQEIFMKYSGIPLRKGTSMALSSVGDAYINFGITGGCIFMFFLGLLYNFVLKRFHKYSKNFPILLLFTPLVFYYPIRPDCELQTILGHLVKSCFLIFVIFLVWKKEFKLPVQRFWKKYSY